MSSEMTSVQLNFHLTSDEFALKIIHVPNSLLPYHKGSCSKTNNFLHKISNKRKKIKTLVNHLDQVRINTRGDGCATFEAKPL